VTLAIVLLVTIALAMIRLDPRAKPIASLSGQLELRLLTPSIAFWVVGIILTHYRPPRRYPRALILFLSKPCPANPILDSIESLNSESLNSLCSSRASLRSCHRTARRGEVGLSADHRRV